MSREWKPGDVAVITEYGGETPAVMVAGDVCEALGHSGSGDHWHYFAHTPDGATWTSRPNPAARPLVVIDPEDREQVERLRDEWDAAYAEQVEPLSARERGARGNALQAALREFANPTPPKPDEPTGLGAVVEATCGCSNESRRYVRDPAARDFNLPWDAKGVAPGAEVPWVARCGHHRYADLAAVKVLSAGVES